MSFVNDHRTDQVLVAQGVIDVPPGTPTRDFRHLEGRFRHLLWPPTAAGMSRWRRVLKWRNERTQLSYAIYDVPS